MPEFGKSAVLIDGVTSTGVGSSYWSNKALTGGLAHFDGTSFNAQVQGTNFFDPNIDVGSRWTGVGSVQTVAGFQALPPSSPFAAYRISVNSVVSTTTISVALSF